MASPAQLGREIFHQTGTSPESTARPSKAPPAIPSTTALAKAPPPGVMQMFDPPQQPSQHLDIYRWLNDIPLEATTAAPPQAQAGSRGTAEQRDLSACDLQDHQDQDQGITPEHTASVTATVGALRVMAASMHRNQAPPQHLEENAWADFAEDLTQASSATSTAASSLHPISNTPHHPRQRRTLWDSWRFNPRPATEDLFLATWLKALREHDFGTNRVWQQYCIKRGDGTYDPAKLHPTFIRRYLFIYGSQPPNFFTQNLACGLLTAAEETDILREAAHIYQATHEGNTPPHSSITWPPRPEQLPPAQHTTAPQQDRRAATTAQHPPTHQWAAWPAQTAHHNAMHQQYNTPWEENHWWTAPQESWHSQHVATRQDWHCTPAWRGWEEHQPGWSWSLHASWEAWQWH